MHRQRHAGVSDVLRTDRQAGFTLIELMLSLLLGLIVLGGVLGVFITTYQSSSQDIKRVRLNEEMRAVMEMMSGDIRRAGSWQRDATAWSVTAITAENPFSNATHWAVTRYGSEPSSSCAVFSYGTGTVGAPAVRYGFGLRERAVWRRKGDGGAMGCAIASPVWERLSDERAVAITGLNYAVTLEPGAPGVQLRTVVITLDAAVNTRSANPTRNAAGTTLSAADCTNQLDIVCRRMVQKVRVRNDVPPP